MCGEDNAEGHSVGKSASLYDLFWYGAWPRVYSWYFFVARFPPLYYSLEIRVDGSTMRPPRRRTRRVGAAPIYIYAAIEKSRPVAHLRVFFLAHTAFLKIFPSATAFFRFKPARIPRTSFCLCSREYYIVEKSPTAHAFFSLKFIDVFFFHWIKNKIKFRIVYFLVVWLTDVVIETFNNNCKKKERKKN